MGWKYTQSKEFPIRARISKNMKLPVIFICSYFMFKVLFLGSYSLSSFCILFQEGRKDTVPVSVYINIVSRVSQ